MTLGPAQPNQRVRDQPFFVFMAALLLATAIAGFTPNIGAILAGTRPVPPPLIHIHAALMYAWLLLLLAQTSLNAFGHRDLHQRLGVIAFVLVPAIVLVLILASFGNLWTQAEWPPRRYNLILLQMRSVTLFPLFAYWAVGARRSSPGTHKRLMIIATVVLLDAAISRIHWLPGTGSRNSGYELQSAYQLLLLAPIVLYDVLTIRRVHRASIIGIGLFALWAIVANLLWGSDWWLRTAPRLLGISG